MSILVNAVFAIYITALLLITFYCLLQLNLLYNYKKFHRTYVPKVPGIQPPSGQLPFVTIQLPVFNEMYVVERLIDNIMQLDYPKDRFEVHLLDDSTDGSVEVARKKIEYYRAKGFQIEQIFRDDRKGYKAGALKDAMPKAKGEFIAIFDADFMPKKDFLKKTLHHFEDEKVGVVQTRWEHLNENYSLITRLQAMQLNVHFSIEQQGRRGGNYLLQFNGTAGIWRRATIEDAGGWEADTLTEDLDLSIRAQLKGWKINYLEEVGSPAELPAEMNGLKSQQFRWMKGGAETAKKMLPTIWHSKLTFSQKFHASMQLLGSSIFVCIFIMGVMSVPALFLLGGLHFGPGEMFWALSGFVAFMAVQYVANVQVPGKEIEGGYWKRLAKFIVLFPLFLALSMGLSLHNTVAVVQGWLGKQSAFIRTPKFNIQGLRDTFKSQDYLATKISWTTFFEGGLAVYFLAAAFYGYQMENMQFLLLHILLSLGYGIIFYYTLAHLKFK
ncbi:MAG TPA: glycosyltransferase [Bacteroidetes bacterium]|nr:glycosyltransferase [Bacteroidota bacterium]